MSKIEIKKISIIESQTDCIVNAANNGLFQGGGVCGAIFRAAGPADLTRACQVLEGLTGRPVRYWRPPHGFRDPAAMQTARDLGLAVVTWSTAPRDWTGIAAGDIVQRVVNKAEPGAIVLLHDGDSPYYRASRQPTVDAAGPLIDTLRQQGYTLVPLADRK